MANMTLDELRSSLAGLDTYTPETEDALRQRAENIYNPQYQRDLQDLRDNLQSALVQQNLNSVSTGMQRSSYNNASNAALRAGGLRAQADLAGNYESSVAALLNDLIQGEKDRAQAADQYRNNLLMQLYEYGKAGGSGGGPGTTLPTDPEKDPKSGADEELDKMIKQDTTPQLPGTVIKRGTFPYLYEPVGRVATLTGNPTGAVQKRGTIYKTTMK